MPIIEKDSRINPQTGTPDYYNINKNNSISPDVDWGSMRRLVALSSPVREYVGEQFEPFGGVKPIDEKLSPEDLYDIPEGRAQSQSGFGLIGKAIGQSVNEAVLGTLEAAGYISDVPGVYNALAGNEQEFDNWWSRFWRETKENIENKYMHIYQTKDAIDGKIWDRTALASGSKNLATSLSLMIPAIGVARGVNIAGKIVGMGAKSLALTEAVVAGTVSRAAESTMEAQQYLKQYTDQNKTDLTKKYEAAAFEEINRLPIAIPPNENGFTPYSAEQRAVDEQRIINKYKAQIDAEASRMAIDGANNVFKSNAALAVVDAMQFAPIFRGIGSFTKGVKGGKSLEVGLQMGSEAAEEIYQSGVQAEAYGSIKAGEEMFGPGFSERFGEYLSSNEMKQSAFWGALGGGIFTAAAPLTKKAIDTYTDVELWKNRASTTGNIEAFTKLDNDLKEDLIYKYTKRGRLDRLSEDLSTLESTLNDQDWASMGISKEEAVSKINSMKEDIAFISEEKTKLDIDPRFEGNENAKLDFLKTKLTSKNNSRLIKDISTSVNDLYKEIAQNNELSPELLGIKKAVDSINGLKELKKNLNNIPSFKKDKKLREAVSKRIDTKIQDFSSRLEQSKENYAAANPGENINTLIKTSLDQQLSDKIYKLNELSAVQNDVIKPRLAAYENIKNIKEKESEISSKSKDAEKEGVKESVKQAVSPEDIDSTVEAAPEEDVQELDRIISDKADEEAIDAPTDPITRYTGRPNLFTQEMNNLEGNVLFQYDGQMSDSDRAELDMIIMSQNAEEFVNNYNSLAAISAKDPNKARLFDTIKSFYEGLNQSKEDVGLSSNVKPDSNEQIVDNDEEVPIVGFYEGQTTTSDIGYTPTGESKSSDISPNRAVIREYEMTGGRIKVLNGIPVENSMPKSMNINWDYLNSEESLKEGSEIYFVVNLDETIGKNRSQYHKNLKDEDFINKAQILIAQRDQQGNEQIVNALPSYSANDKSVEGLKLKNLRDKIWQDVKSSNKRTGKYDTGIATKVTKKYAGRILVSKTKQAPHKVIKKGDKLILGIATEINGVVSINAGKEVSAEYSGITVDSKNNGGVFILTRGANGRIVPARCFTKKIESFPRLYEEAKSLLLSSNKDNWANNREELRKIVYLDYNYNPKTDSFEVYFGAGRVNTFNKTQLDDLLRGKIVQVSLSEINKGDYNNRISEEGRISTDLNPFKHIANANFEFSLDYYSEGQISTVTVLPAEADAIVMDTIDNEPELVLPQDKMDTAIIPDENQAVIDAKKADIERRRKEELLSYHRSRGLDSKWTGSKKNLDSYISGIENSLIDTYQSVSKALFKIVTNRHIRTHLTPSIVFTDSNGSDFTTSGYSARITGGSTMVGYGLTAGFVYNKITGEKISIGTLAWDLMKKKIKVKEVIPPSISEISAEANRIEKIAKELNIELSDPSLNNEKISELLSQIVPFTYNELTDRIDRYGIEFIKNLLREVMSSYTVLREISIKEKSGTGIAILSEKYSNFISSIVKSIDTINEAVNHPFINMDEILTNINAKYDAELAALEKQGNDFDSLEDFENPIGTFFSLVKPSEKKNFYQKWDELKETKWFKDRFDESLIDVDTFRSGLIEVNKNGGVQAYGMFKNAVAYISGSAKAGTTYHEAFHVVFHLYLNNKERSQILDEASVKYKIDRSNEIDLEENLADSFMEYVQTEEQSTEKLSTRIKAFFRHLYQLIKSRLTSDLTIENLFYRAQKGYYKTKPFSRDVSKFNVVRYSIPGFTLYEQERRATSLADFMRKSLDFHIENNPEYKSLSRRDVLDRMMHKTNTGSSLKGIDLIALGARANIIKAIKENTGLSPEQKANAAKMLNNFIAIGEDGSVNFLALGREALKQFSRTEGIKVKLSDKSITKLSDSSSSDETALFELQGEDIMGEAYSAKAENISSKESLSNEVRKELSYIPRLNSNGTEVTDDLGFTVYQDFNTVYAYLLRDLSDINDSEEMIERLDSIGITKPYLSVLINKAKTDDLFRSKMFVNFAKSHVKYTTVAQYKNSDTNTTEYRILGSNRMRADSILVDEWKDNSTDSLFNKTIGPDGKYIASHVDALKKLWNNISVRSRGKSSLDNAEINNIARALNYAGITITVEDLQSWNKNLQNPALRSKRERESDLKFKQHLDVIMSKLFSGVNPFEATSFESEAISSVAQYISKFRSELMESSFKNAENNTVYSHQVPSFLSRTIAQFKGKNAESKIKWYQSTAFYKESPWLKELESIESRDNFEFTEIDAIRYDNTDSGVRYTSMSEKDFENTAIHMYFNNGAKNYVYYKFPVVSDAPKMPFIKFKRYTQKEVVNKLYDVYRQEWARINNVKAREAARNQFISEGKEIPDELKVIKNYDHNKSKRFIFLPFLNTGHARKYVEAKNEAGIKQSIIDFLNTEAKIDLDRLNKLGVFSEKDGITEYDSRIISNYGSVEAFHRDYFINSFLANTQMMSIFSGDPAFYKADKDDKHPSIYSRTVDYQKRNKQNVSPKQTIDVNAVYTLTEEQSKIEGKNQVLVSKQYNSIYIKDYEAPSNFAEEIYNAIVGDNTSTSEEDVAIQMMAEQIASAYGYNSSNVTNVTDAQAYITLPRYREIMIGLTRWNDNLQEIYPRLLNGTASNKDLQVVMQPIKPFYFGHTKVGDLIIPTQNKNSEFLLLPQLVKGSKELSKLYNYMIKNNISSANFNSAVKAGEFGAQDIDNIEKASIHILNNEDYGLQQETPEHYLDSNSLFGSQIRKIILSDISDDQVFDIDGKEFTKAELVNLYQDIIKEDLKESFDKVANEFGSIEKLKDLILSEIVNRDLGEERERAVELVNRINKETGLDELRFNLPLFHPYHAKQIESLLNSIFKNNVTKQKIKGGAFVQVSSFGFSNELKLILDGERLVGAEVYLPWWSKKFFEPLLDKNGQLDINRVPMNLREMIGYRIPTEDKYSMLPLVVKGFLPAGSGGAVMLPMEITTISGSDFDIDKMYIMMPEFETVGNDIVKVKYDYSKNIKTTSKIEIKEGVDFVFEQNPELSNTIYEALGFIKNIPIEDISREIEDQNIVEATLENKKYGYPDNNNPILLEEALPNPNFKYVPVDGWHRLARAIERGDTSIKAFVGKLTSEQKQQAQQLYSQYLNSINVTSIAFHHSEEDVPRFTSSSERYFQKELKKKGRYIPKLDDIVFLVKKPLTEEFMSKRNFVGSWGLKTPKTLKFNAGEKIGVGVHPGIDEGIFAAINGNYDAVDFGKIRDNKTWSEVIAITNPNNAIKLGSKQDAEGFRNFVKSRSNLLSIQSKQARNNAKIDIIRAILSSHDTVAKIFKPGGFPTLEKLALNVLKLEGKADEMLPIALPSTQTELFKRNMTGKKLIGIFANHNANHAVLQYTQIGLASPIELNGESYASLHEVKNKNGDFISRNVAEWLAAVVDNAKNPLSSFINVNTYTADVAAMLTRLGFNLDTVVYFMSQPSLKEFSRLYFLYGANKQAENKAKSEILGNFAKIKATDKEPNFTNAELVSAISDKNIYTNFQYSVFNNFNYIKDMSKALADLVRATRADTKGAGPTLSENESIIRLRQEAMDNLLLINHQDLLTGEVYPMEEAFMWYGIERPTQILSKYFPWTSPAFNKIKDRISKQIKSQRLTVSQIEKINYELLGYAATGFEFFDGSDRSQIINGMAKKVRAFKSKYPEKYDSNFFINKLVFKKDDKNASLPERVQFKNTGSLTDLDKQQIKKHWNELMVDPDLAIDKEFNTFAKDLVKYAFYTAGFQLTPNSFSHLIPVDFYSNLTDSNGQTFNDYLDKFWAESKNEEAYNEFIEQFFRNNYNDLSLVPAVDTKDFSNISGNVERMNGKPVYFKVTDSMALENRDLIVRKDEFSTTFAPFVSLREKGNVYLFKKVDEKVASTGYVLTEKLGIPGYVLEYEKNNVNPKSVVSQNNVFIKNFTQASILEKFSKDDTVEVKPKDKVETGAQLDEYSNITENLRSKIMEQLSLDESLAGYLDITINDVADMDIEQLGEVLKKICNRGKFGR